MKLALSTSRFDVIPLAIVLIVSAAAFVLISDGSIWANLTIAGFSVGVMIFIMASGLTLIFGLMDVMNFAHAALITVGGYLTASVLTAVGALTLSDSVGSNVLAIALAAVTGMLVCGAMGILIERLIVRPVYGSHMKQILATMGSLIVIEQIVLAIWGPDIVHIPKPTALKGSWVIGELVLDKFRLVVCVLGVLLFAAMIFLLTRSRVGLLIRAGVEDGEMVEALGYPRRLLFVGVFAIGSAFAAFGGTLWVLYQEVVHSATGLQTLILIFTVIIIGGLGSITGCFIASILLGLLMNYVGFLLPSAVVVCSLFLLLAVLVWRPNGLYPVVVR